MGTMNRTSHKGEGRLRPLPAVLYIAAIIVTTFFLAVVVDAPWLLSLGLGLGVAEAGVRTWLRYRDRQVR
jgi:hypothetical protein